MDRQNFRALVSTEFDRLFAAARQQDELSFLFAALGIDSGVEDAGWQPIGETHALIADLVGLINGPLYDNAKIRIALLLYSHIIEANYPYHCLYNMLLTVDRQPPKVFNFLNKYRNGIPPSFSSKISDIKTLASKCNFPNLNDIFLEIIRTDIRNAFFHSDYIIFGNELRLKHRGSEFSRIKHSEVIDLTEKAVEFFNLFMKALIDARKAFPKGYIITGRKSPQGHNLASVEVTVDDAGIAIGFKTSDPLPIW